MIPPLSSEQLEAARQLVGALTGVPLALVGAAALGCHLPLRSKTEDVDFVVATSVEAAAALLQMPGWKRHAHKEHAWTAPNGVAVDVVPASAEAIRQGFMDWPESGHRMNLLGMRLVFERSVFSRIAEEVELLVPSVPIIALLKMIAYQDRHDRTYKDLLHLADIFDGYPSDDDERMFTHEQAAARLTPDEARVQVFARELAGLVDPAERAGCGAFFRLLREPVHAARMLQSMSQPTDDREGLLLRRLEILEHELAG